MPPTFRMGSSEPPERNAFGSQQSKVGISESQFATARTENRFRLFCRVLLFLAEYEAAELYQECLVAKQT